MKKIITSIICVAIATASFAQVNLDFESPATGAEMWWGAYAGGIIEKDLANPKKVAPNTSNTVMAHTALSAANGGAPHSLTLTTGSPVAFTNNNCIVKMMVYKTVMSDVAMKFETSDEGEPDHVEAQVEVPNTIVNGWQELTFNFSAHVGKSFLKLIIISDYRAGREADITTLFDNITFSSLASLPITLTSFTGKVTNDGNLLEWKSSSEINFNSFEVERSDDGKAFSILKTVPSGQYSYSFLDRNVSASQTYYYRLKMIDSDGTTTFSSIQSVKTKLDQGGTSNVYPNPAVNDIQVNYISSSTNPLDVVIIDSKGSIVNKSTHSAQIGNNKISVNISTLISGTYVMQILNSDQTKSTFKFIKR